MVEKIDPSEDIDVMHEVDYLRIERMDYDTLWFAGYRNDGPDIHYNAISTVDSDDDDGVFEEGLTVSTWSEGTDEEGPVYEIGDRLIQEAVDNERVVKQRFWDMDSKEYNYAIGFEGVPESFEIWSESDLTDFYQHDAGGGEE